MLELRRPAILLALGAALALVSFTFYPATRTGTQAAQPAAARSPGAAPRMSASPLTGAGGTAVADVPAKPSAPRLPFTYFGKMREGGETVIVLSRGGQVVKVSRIGPLDESYHVEAIHDERLVLRYLPLDERQVLELSSRQYALTAAGPAEESPQD